MIFWHVGDMQCVLPENHILGPAKLCLFFSNLCVRANVDVSHPQETEYAWSSSAHFLELLH